MAFLAGAAFAVELNGASVGTQYDQLDVAGAVNLGHATLALTLGYTPTVGDQFMILNNDGSDPVTGVFRDPLGQPLAEGDAFTVGGQRFTITYQGGTNGNGVVLRAVVNVTTDVRVDGSGNLVVTDAAGGSTDDTLTVRLSSGLVVVSDPNNMVGTSGVGIVIDPHTVGIPVASVTGSLLVSTLGGNDSLTVDFSGGNPVLHGALTFAGGTGSNKLVLTGGSFLKQTFDYANAHDGTIELDSDGTGTHVTTLTYTGLAPILVNVGTPNDIIFNLPNLVVPVGVQAVLQDNGSTPADGKSQLASTNGTFEVTTFANPARSLTINGGTGNDAITVDAGFATGGGGGRFQAALTITGGGGTDTATLNAPLSLGSSSSSGEVFVSASTIALNNSIDTSGNATSGPAVPGNVTFTGSAVLQTSVSITTHSAAADGSVTFQNSLTGTTSGGQGLTVNAGAGGDVSFSGIVGATPLGAITVLNGKDFTEQAGIHAASLQVISAGTATFYGAVDTSGGAGVGVTADNLFVHASVTSHDGPISLQAAGGITLDTSGTVVNSGTGPLVVYQDNDSGGDGTLTLNDDATLLSANTTTSAISLRAADIGIVATAAVMASGSAGGVLIRSSVASLPISVGGGTAVTGIRLNDAEMARITTAANGQITIGDSTQTGAILLVTAAPATTAGAATVVVQSTSGAGQIVLDDGGTGVALNGNGGTVTLTAGTGGIQAATAPNVFAEIDNATAVTLTSVDGIGTTQSLQLGATNLNTHTAASNGQQFLSALAPVTVTGLDAGTGTLNLLGGTFNLSGSHVLADASSLNLSGGATLALAGFQDTVAGLTLTSGNLTGSGGTLTSAGSFQMQSGSVSAILAGTTGTIGLTKTTSGTVTLSGANTYTGPTLINAGILAIDQGGSVNTSSGIWLGDTSGTAAATLNLVDADGGTTVSAPLTIRAGSSGTKTIQGGNTSGSNTLSSALTVNASFTVSAANAGGTLQLTGAAVALAANTLTVDTVGTVDVQRTITADAVANYRLVKSNTGKLIVGGSADNTNLSIQLNAGTLELAKTTANATNNLQIAGGTAKLTGSNDAQISNASPVTFTGSGVLDLNGRNEAVDGLAGTVGQVTNSAAGTTSTLTVGVSGGSSGFAGTLVDGAGTLALAKVGAGNLALYPTGDNTYSGKTVVTGGILGITKDTALGAVPASPQSDNLTLDGGTLCDPASPDTAGNLGSTASNVNLHANRGVVLGNSGGTFRIFTGGNVAVNGIISGTGHLTMTDRGTLGLMGNNTYSGRTSVTGGTLSVVADSGLGVVPSSFQSDNLTLDGGTLANMRMGPTFSVGDDVVLGVNRGATLGATGGGVFRTGYTKNITVNGVISGSGNLRKTDGSATAGTLILNAVNTFTGTTDWFATAGGRGVIKVGHVLALQNSTVVMDTGTNGALDLNSALDNVVLGGLADNGANQGNVTIPDGKTLKVGNNSNPATYQGGLSGAGSTVEKIGSGTWTLEGNATSTAAWKITSGTLYATAPGALGTGPVTAHGGVLQVGSAETSVSGFASGWTYTGNASPVSANVIQLTPNVTWQNGSAFFARPVPTTSDFATSFTFDTPTQGPSPADGVAFVLQNDSRGLTAMGAQGNCLGYSANTSTGVAGILPSAALQIDIYAGDANGRGIRMATNGSGGGGATNISVAPVDLTGTVTFNLSYNAAAKTLTVLLAEGAHAFGPYTFTAFDLPSILGQTAYVGFTGATGGSYAQQQISNFTFTSAATPATTYPNTLTVAADVTGNVSVVGTSVNPTITLGPLTMGANATLNLSAAGSSPPDSNYGLTVGATTLNAAPTFTVANHGTGTGTLTLGALADGGTARTVSKQGPGVLALAAGATSLVDGTQVNVVNGTLRSDQATALGTLAKVDVAGGTTFRVGASQTIGTLTGSGSTTLNGQTLTVGSTNNLSGTFAGVLSDGTGAGGVTKAGSGTWTLTGANTFSGPLSVAAGTLAVPTVNNDGLPGPLGQSALPVTLGSSGLGGTLEYTGANATSTKKFLLAAGGSGTFQIDTAGTSLAVSGLVSGNGDLLKTGAGTLGLGGANTYKGNTTISQGTLQVTADGALGTTAGLTQIGSSGTLQFSHVTYGTAETVRITGAGGTLDSLGGNNSFAGNVVLLADGTLSSSTPGETLTLNGSISSNGAVSELTVTGAGDMRLAGSVSGTFGLTKQGAGVVTLGASNSYVGNTAVLDGTLRLGANDVIPDGTGYGNVAVNGTGTLDLNGFRDTLNGLSGTGTVDSTSGSGTLTVGNNNATSTFSGIIQNNGGSLALTKLGSGTLTLAGQNTYSGDTTIQAGTISVSENNNLGAATATLILDNNGTLLQTGSFTTTRPVRLDSGGGTLNVVPGVTRIQAGIVSGVGQLTKIGEGTWEPTAINTYTGGTYLHEGTLIQHAAGNLGPQPGTVPFSSNYLYVDNGAHVLVDATYSAFPGRGLYIGDGGAVYGETAGQVNFRNGPMQNWPGTTGGLTIDTLGTQGLGGNNTFTGDVAVLNGTLSISRDVNLGNAANPVILHGGTTLQAADGRMTWEGPDAYPGGYGEVVAGTITTNRTVTLASGTVTLEVLNGANPQQNLSPLSPLPSHTNTLTLTGPVVGNGALSKTGPGILTLAANNTYTGATTVHDGTLSLQGPLGHSGAISLAGGILGGNGTVGAITMAGSGTVSPGNGTGDGTGSAGVLHSGAVVWDTNTTFLAELFSGAGPGSGHDQLQVTGNVSLGNATLDFRPSFTPSGGANFTIVNNDGADPVVGTFRDTLGNVLTDGAVFTVGGRPFRINYAGGDGNDVVLTYQSSVTVAFASASGSGAETFPNPTIAVQLSASSSETVTVTYTVRGDSTATPGGVDYTLAAPGTLVFSPGSTTQNIPITINHNPTFEADKTVILVLSDPVNAQLGSQTVFTYTILETDPAHPVCVWDGGSTTSNNWTDPINWETDTAPTGNGTEELVFGKAGAARKASSFNDFDPGKAFGQITFHDSGYTLSGQAATLNGGGVVADTAGTNTIALNVALGDSQTWSAVASGTLNFNGSLASNGKLLTTAGAGSLNLNNQITGAGGLTAAGTGVVTLTGNNTYDGLTTVDAGTLIVRSASGLGSTANGTVVDDGATLRVEGSFTLPEPLTVSGNGSTGEGALMSVSGNTTLSGHVTLNSSSTIGVVQAGETLTIAGVVSGVSGADLAKLGSGTLILTNAGNTYSGQTTIQAGELQLGNAGVLPDGGRVTLAGVPGAVLNLNGHDETIGSLSGGGTLGGNVLLGTVTLTLGGDDSSTTFSGKLSGSGGLTKRGTGTLTLAGQDTYTGNTTISSGTLQLGSNQALAPGNVAVVGRLDLAGYSGTIQGLTGNGSVDTTSGTSTLTVGLGDATSTFAGQLLNSSGLLTLAKSGSGTLTLSGSNSYSGGTLLEAGTLSIGADVNLGDLGSALTIENNATLRFTATLGISRNIILGVGGGSVDVPDTITVAAGGVISGTLSSGTGRLTKIGNGTWVPTAMNTYEGGTYVHQGTLVQHASGNLGPQPDSSDPFSNYLYVDNGAQVLVDATYSAFPGRSLYIGDGGAVYGETAGHTNFRQGPLVNPPSTSGGLTIDSLGIQGLGGDNTFTGNVTVLRGDLSISRDVNLGNASNAVILKPGAELQIADGRDNWGGAAPFPIGNGSMVQGTFTTNRTITLDGGEAFIGVLNTTSPGWSVNPTPVGYPLPPHVNTFTVASPIVGPGALNKLGPGSLALTAQSTYSGATTVTDGTLLVNGPDGRIGATVLAGGILSGNGTVGPITMSTTGTVSPGNGTGNGTGSTGILHSGTVTWNATAAFRVEVNGNTPGTDHDQLQVAGNVSLGDATLTLSRAVNYVPTGTGVLVIIDNHGSDAVGGTFQGLAEGAAVTLPGDAFPVFTISYVGGDGNDVVLKRRAPTGVYVDDAWAGTPLGTNPNYDPIGGLIFGYNAFATPQAALDQVAVHGTVTVYGGSYGGAAVNQTLTEIVVATNPYLPAESTVQLAGAVTLGASTTFRENGATNLVFASTVCGTTAGNQALTITGSNGLTLQGPVGTVAVPLASLTTGAGLSTALDGGGVQTTGDQAYGGAVTLGANATLATSTGDITFGSTLNSAANGAYTLSASSGTGDLTFTAAVGSGTNQELGALTIASAADVTFSADVRTAGNLTQTSGTGATSFHGASVVGDSLSLTTRHIALDAGNLAVANRTTFQGLNAGGSAVSQAAGTTLLTTDLLLLGNGTFTLDQPLNHISGNLAANVLGSLSYRDAGSLQIGTVGATSGLTTGNATLTIQAQDSISIGSSAALNAGTGHLSLTAETGSIDGSGLLTADLLTLQAVSGIGGTTALCSNVTTLDAVNSGISGNIQIDEVPAGGSIDVQRLAQGQAGGTGSIRLTTANGTLTVLGSGSGVSTLGSGSLTLTANGADQDVNLNATVSSQSGTITITADGGNGSRLNVDVPVTSQQGPIRLRADQDVRGHAAGAVTSHGGNVEITANYDNTSLGPNHDGTIEMAGDITAGAGTVTFSLGDCSGYLDGNIVSASDVTKNGAGALRLNGASNTYTGTTTINNGTLLINGTLAGAGGAVTVTGAPSGTLGGNGTINRAVNVNGGGTLDPGDCDPDGTTISCSPQPGRLLVSGNLTFVPGATFRVQLGGLNVGPGVGTYDQLQVNGLVNLGGDPFGVPTAGATLDCSFVTGFPVPVGAEFHIILNDPGDLIDTRFQHSPEGTLQDDDFLSCGGYVMNISYYSFTDHNDVTLTHPGRYDFNANPPVTEPTYEGVNLNPYYDPMYPGSSPGWNIPVMAVGRGGSEGSSLPRDAYTPIRLLQDLAVTGTTATFLVDAAARDADGNPQQYQVVLTSGDYGFEHEASQFTLSGDGFVTSPTGVVSTGLSQFGQLVLGPVAVQETDAVKHTGLLQIRMTYAGHLSGWTAVLNGLDIRPVSSVGLIAITRDDGLRLTTTAPVVQTGDPVSADGLTIDDYTGTNAAANSLLTVTTTTGTIVTPDLDRYLQGVQVLSDASGTFTFQIRRPSGTGGTGSSHTGTITAWEIGGRSYGQVGQIYDQNYSAVGSPRDPIGYRRFDFNNSSSPTATDYLSVLPDVPYTDTNGYGWDPATPVGAVDRLQSTDYLRRDFHWAQTGTFQIQVTPGATYNLQALFGEPTDGALYTTGPHANQLGGSGAFFSEGSANDPSHPGVSPTTITITVDGSQVFTVAKPLMNKFVDLPFTGQDDGDGLLNIAFSAAGGGDPYFAIDGLAIWQAAAVPDPGNPQLLAGEAPDGGGTGAVVTQGNLGPIVAEARARWEVVGLTAAQSATLWTLDYGVTDLPGQSLASTDRTGNLIVVDQHAAGRGWFIDPTPWEDSEYVQGPAPAGVDLLTVMMHEMGHALGYQDLDNSQFPQALMALQLLSEQARRVPTGPLVTGTNPVLPSDVNGDGEVTPADVLLLVNRLNASGAPLTPVESGSHPTFCDVTGDNVLSASDALYVVNYLNTPRVAQQNAPMLGASSSTPSLILATPNVPPAPAGSPTATTGMATPVTAPVPSPTAGTASPVPVWPEEEGENDLSVLAADVQAAQSDELAADAIFQELGRVADRLGN